MTNVEIDLALGYGRLKNRQPFLIASGSPVVLTFNSAYALSDCIVKFVSDTGEKASVRVQNLVSLTVPQEFVRAGSLRVSLGLVLKERVLKTWDIEPIVFAETDTGFSGMPEFEEILSRLNAVENLAAQTVVALEKVKAESTRHGVQLSELFTAIEQ